MCQLLPVKLPKKILYQISERKLKPTWNKMGSMHLYLDLA